MSACENCGAEVIAALTPRGRSVELDCDDTWVLPNERWPTDVFSVDFGGTHGPAVEAMPAIEILHRDHDGRSGPFRREHACSRGVA